MARTSAFEVRGSSPAQGQAADPKTGGSALLATNQVRSTLKGVNMENDTKEVLKSYIEREIPFAKVHTFRDDEFVPVPLMVLASKLDTLIRLAEDGRSGE